MPVLGCGAEMAKLMDVSDQDVATIEDVIAERLALGVSQPVAQRQAVDEALAQLAEERSMVMKAVMEQLGFDLSEKAPVMSNKAQPDLFPGEFATKKTKGDSGVVISSKGDTLKGENVNSDGQKITATKQGVDNFWKWFGNSVATDDKGRPLVLYHSTNADTDVLKANQKTTNNYGLLGDVEVSRAGIFATADRNFSQDYLRSGDGKNVMQIYMALKNPLDLTQGLTEEQDAELSDAGIRTQWIYNIQNHWELFDNADDGTNDFVTKLKELGYDGAVFNEEGQDGETHTTYMAFDSNQIKSATGNLGTFNPQDDRIVFSNKQTETPEFKEWFGNSKITNSDGSPKVLYHGTDKDFHTFKTGRGGYSGPAIWLAPQGEFQPTAMGLGSHGNYRTGANVIPVYAKMVNPLLIDSKTMRDWAVNAFANGDDNFPQLVSDRIIKDIKEAGYDGIIFKGTELGWGKNSDEYILFDPKQIKSAIGNSGAFDPANPSIIASNKAEGAIIDRDAAGRARLAIARQSADLLGRLGGTKILDRLYLKQPSAAVKEQIRKMKIDVQRSLDTAVEIAGEVNKMPAAEREMVSGIIEGELKTGVIPPQHAVDTAAMMNTAMGKQTDELVRLGMLSKDAADRWRDKYLPRYYEPKLANNLKETWASFVQKQEGFPRPIGGIKGKHLKGRGMIETIDVNKLADFQALGWEIRDKSYDPATSQEVRVWRDFTPQEREKMGEIRDAGFRFVMGYMQTQRDIAMGRMYERLAGDTRFSSVGEKDGWVRVPDTKVPDSDAYRYGKLAGRYVPTEVMAQLQTEREMDSEAFKAYKKALAWWKSNKTVMNPVGHMNNFVSNITMAHFAGVSYTDAHKYVGAIKDFATGAQSVKDARDAGLFLGDLTDADLHKLLPPELKAMLDKIDPVSMKALRFVDTLLTFGMRGKMSQAYEFGDKFFKYMIWKDAVANGADPGEAVDHALKYIFNYDDLPRGARLVRDVGLPFFAYTYKAIPALADTLMARPDRFLLPASLIYLANAAAYAIAAGGDDDDWLDSVKKYVTDPEYRAKAKSMEEEERKLLPDWMKGRTALGTQKNIRMGKDQLTDNPVFLDVSRFIPGGDLLDMDSNIKGASPWLQVLTPNNPLLALYSMAVINKDTYFGRDVTKDTDTAGERWGKRADFMWKLATPAIAIGNSMWDKAVQVAARANGGELPIPDAIGGSLTGIGKDGQPVQAKYTVPSMVGVKARPIDLQMSAQVEKSQQRKSLRDLEAELRQARRYYGKGAMSDRVFEKRSQSIREKMNNLRQGLTVDGEERP